jgi:phage shock protein PspC (stress-responsive transcriptional regulator)
MTVLELLGMLVVAGICGGIAQWLGWDPTFTRLLYVLVSIFSAAFPGILVYIILWIVTPEEQAATVGH